MAADLKNRSLQSAAQWIIILTGVLFALIYFKSLLQPFVLAVVVWYLIGTARKYIGKINFRKKALPNWAQRLVAVLLTFSIFFGMYEIISVNIGLINANAANYDKNFNAFLQKFASISELKEYLPRIQESIGNLDYQSIASGVVNSVSTLLGNFTLILIYVVFLVIEENYFSKKMVSIFKNSEKRENFTLLINGISSAVNKYFTVKTEMSLLTAVLSYIVMRLLGVDFPVLWAFIIFILNYIPYIGSAIASLLPALFAIFQFASLWPFIYIFVAVEAVQILVGNYIEPKVMGKTLNLSPLVVILALSFWGAIWGILGMILSVPIVSIIIIICAQFPSTRPVAVMLSENGSIEDLYQASHDEIPEAS
jgi:predicted PurR-regulated permease PerM